MRCPEIDDETSWKGSSDKTPFKNTVFCINSSIVRLIWKKALYLIKRDTLKHMGNNTRNKIVFKQQNSF